MDGADSQKRAADKNELQTTAQSTARRRALTSNPALPILRGPRLLMGYLGLVPSEPSSGGSIRRGGITKSGNREARRMLVEAAWCYRYPARVTRKKSDLLAHVPTSVREIAWKAQTRLCGRYRAMLAKGNKPTVAVTVLVRELAGFVWAVGQEIKITTGTG